MKDYAQFRLIIKNICTTLEQERGVKIKAYKWARQSPYQKARYKEEYVYPEVWLKQEGASLGVCITGKDMQEQGTRLKEYIDLVLF